MIELRAGEAHAIVLPEYGGRLHQLAVTVGGASTPLLVSPADVASYGLAPMWGGSFPMAPWPNRVAGAAFTWEGREVTLPPGPEGNALHGTVLQRTWNVESKAADSCELATELGPGWPWRGSAWQRFTLGEHSLRMEMEVRSDGDAFPAGCGWHPWFRRNVAGSKAVSVRVPARERYVLESHLPTGERVPPSRAANLARLTCLGNRRLDDCYGGLSAPVTVAWEGGSGSKSRPSVRTPACRCTRPPTASASNRKRARRTRSTSRRVWVAGSRSRRRTRPCVSRARGRGPSRRPRVSGWRCPGSASRRW